MESGDFFMKRCYIKRGKCNIKREKCNKKEAKCNKKIDGVT